MRLRGACGHIKNQHATRIQQACQKSQFTRQIGQMFQNIERKDSIEALLTRCCRQRFFRVKKRYVQPAPLRSPLGETGADTVNIVLSRWMPAPGQLQNYLTVPGAVVETCAAPELQNFQVRANTLVIQVVA